MPAKGSNAYPSPTAAQTAGGVGPYPGQHADAQPDELELGAQLRHELKYDHPEHPAGPEMSTDPHHEANDLNGHAATADMSRPSHSPSVNPAYAHQAYAQQAYQQLAMANAQPGIGLASPNMVAAAAVAAGASPDIVEEADAAERKKQNKASRACDICRRKKIKCDADPDVNNTAPCSNCKRIDPSMCQFTRQPMKRGPSKGYIKNLEDRVGVLEERLHKPSQDSATHPASDPLGSRKRSFSHLDPLGPDSSLLESPTSALDPFRPSTAIDSPFSPSPNASSKQANGLAAVIYQETLSPSESRTLEQYFSRTHPGFPVLSSDSTSLLTLLMSSPKAIRDGFFQSIDALLATDASGSRSRISLLQATWLPLQHFPLSVATAPEQQALVVYLLALCFLYAALDMAGPEQNLFPSRPLKYAIHGAARTVAERLMPSRAATSTLFDEAYALARRAWVWISIIEVFDGLAHGIDATYRISLARLNERDRELVRPAVAALSTLTWNISVMIEVLQMASDKTVAIGEDLPTLDQHYRSHGHYLSMHADVLQLSREAAGSDASHPALELMYHMAMLLLRLVEQAHAGRAATSLPSSAIQSMQHIAAAVRAHAVGLARSPLTHHALGLVLQVLQSVSDASSSSAAANIPARDRDVLRQVLRTLRLSITEAPALVAHGNSSSDSRAIRNGYDGAFAQRIEEILAKDAADSSVKDLGASEARTRDWHDVLVSGYLTDLPAIS